jgi:hypothetical protein
MGFDLCLPPWVCGPDFYFRDSVVTAQVAVTPMLPSNVERVGVYFVNGGTNTVNLAISGLVSSTNGFQVGGSQKYLDFTWDTWGPIVSGQWFGFALAAPTSIYIVELMFRPREGENVLSRFEDRAVSQERWVLHNTWNGRGSTSGGGPKQESSVAWARLCKQLHLGVRVTPNG